MTVFKPIETYADAGQGHSYKNSREAVLRLPFPYPEDQYMYSMNVEPHVPFGTARCAGSSTSTSITSPNVTTVRTPSTASRACTTPPCRT
jgi:hypothetical protein